MAGYSGQIPNPELIVNATDFGVSGDSATDNSIAIQDAINFLGGRQGIIYFPAGVYLFNSPISLSDSVVLRGESSNLTHFVFDLGGESINCINISKNQPGEFFSVTGGFEKGSSQIVVGDPSMFEANAYLELRQLNGSWDTNPALWAQYSVGQMLFIDSISADTLFLANPLRIGYDVKLSPEIRVIKPVHEVGVECLKISRVDNTQQGVGYNIYLAFAANCWIGGIESNKSVGSHIYITRSTNLKISGCYIHDAFDYNGTGTRGYGITLNYHTGLCLIENNILRHLRHALMVKTGANGNVFGYNYSIEPYRSEPFHDFSGDISLHGHYAFSNLFEGNVVQNIIIDHYWGPSGPWNTMFRNRAELFGIIMTPSDTTGTSSQNFIGNEVPNTIYGAYALSENDHFEYGNTVKDSIFPEGSSELNDTSYYLSTIPPFWNIFAPWPSLGIPNTLGEHSIPAKERYWSGGIKTFCSDSGFIGTTSPLDKTHELLFWPNPNNGIIHLTQQNRSFDFTLFSLEGRKMLFRKGIQDQIQLPESIPNGMYFLQMFDGETVIVEKLILNK